MQHAIASTPATLLDREYQTAQELLAVLRREQQCLIDADADGVSALLAEKSQLAARAAELASARHRALAAAGFEAGETGMNRWTSSLPDGSAALHSWRSLLDIARDAREINRLNGVLIARLMSRNQAALSVLRGTGPQGDMYGPNGQASTHAPSRSRVIG